MLNITYNEADGSFLTNGTWNMGKIGGDVYPNISYNYEELCAVLEKNPEYLYGKLKNDLSNRLQSGGEYASALTEFYNSLELEVAKNISRIENHFLLYGLSDMYASHFEFWKIAEVLKDEYKDKTFNANEVYANHEDFEKLVYEWQQHKIAESEVLNALEKFLPMFDFETFFDNIGGDSLTFDLNIFSYQCSDTWSLMYDSGILCGAYDEIDENFEFLDWHNF